VAINRRYMLNFLWVIAVILLIIFLLSLVFHFIASPLLYILLVIAVIFLLIWLVQLMRTRH
jgi:hypothetical protein